MTSVLFGGAVLTSFLAGAVALFAPYCAFCEQAKEVLARVGTDALARARK